VTGWNLSKNGQMTMASDQDRIKTLEARVAELEAKLCPAQQPPKARVTDDEAGVRFLTPPPVNYGASASDLIGLRKVVLSRFPRLGPDIASRFADMDEAHWHAQFEAAVQFLLQCGRIDGLDERHHVSWWTDQCAQWLAGQGYRTSVGIKPFAAAAVACGDIRYGGLDRPPYGWAFSIVHPGAGRPASLTSWRSVLQGQILPPTALRVQRDYDVGILRMGS